MTLFSHGSRKIQIDADPCAASWMDGAGAMFGGGKCGLIPASGGSSLAWSAILDLR